MADVFLMTGIAARRLVKTGTDFGMPWQPHAKAPENVVLSRILRSTGRFAKLREPDRRCRP
jgi:hypothetical protein